MYKIGDIITPKYERNKDWGERLIVDYHYNEYDNNSFGYLWVYSDMEVNEKNIRSSHNGSDPELNVYWKLKTIV